MGAASAAVETLSDALLNTGGTLTLVAVAAGTVNCWIAVIHTRRRGATDEQTQGSQGVTQHITEVDDRNQTFSSYVQKNVNKSLYTVCSRGP